MAKFKALENGFHGGHYIREGEEFEGGKGPFTWAVPVKPLMPPPAQKPKTEKKTGDAESPDKK